MKKKKCYDSSFEQPWRGSSVVGSNFEEISTIRLELSHNLVKDSFEMFCQKMLIINSNGAGKIFILFAS